MKKLIEFYRNIPMVTQLTVIVAGIIVIAGILAAYSVYNISLNDLIEVEKRNLLSIEGQMTHELARIFNDSMDAAVVLASQESVSQYLSSGFPKRDVPALLRMFNTFNIRNDYSAIYLLNAAGTGLVSTDPTFVGQNYAFRKYFKEASEGKTSVQMAIGVTSKLPGYYFSAPVYGKGRAVIGVIVMKRSPVFINELISEYLKDKSSVKFMLTDELGVVIASNVQSRVYQSLGVMQLGGAEKAINESRFPGMDVTPLHYNTVQNIVENYTAPATIDVNDTQEGAREVLAVSRIDGFSFFAIHEAGLSDIEAAALNAALMLGLLSVLAALVVALIIVFVLRATLRVITKVVDAAVRISEGNFKERLKVNGGAEMNALTSAFNSMVERLDNLYSSMEEKIRVATANIAARAQESEYQRQAVTEAKKNIELENNKHTAILESIDNAVAVIDCGSNILFANKSAGRLFSVNESAFVGKSLYELVKTIETLKGEIVPRNSILERALKTQTALTERLVLVLNNGKRISVLMTASPFSQGGEVSGIVVVLRDIAEEEKFEEVRSGFISIAAHQLRGPLTAIKWFGEMLAEGIGGKLNAKQSDLAGEINSAAARMGELVNTLLQTARLEAGRVKVVPVPLDPVTLVKEVSKSLDIFKKKMKQKIEIVSSLPARTKISMDRDFLWLVLQNLIANALHYSPKGSTITITLFEHGDMVECQIKDVGIGIPKDVQSEIFKKFYRARNAIRLVPEGSGIGLSLAKMLVESWGGRIWFESEENKGAIFKFTMPKSGMMPKKGDVKLAAE